MINCDIVQLYLSSKFIQNTWKLWFDGRLFFLHSLIPQSTSVPVTNYQSILILLRVVTGWISPHAHVMWIITLGICEAFKFD